MKKDMMEAMEDMADGAKDLGHCLGDAAKDLGRKVSKMMKKEK